MPPKKRKNSSSEAQPAKKTRAAKSSNVNDSKTETPPTKSTKIPTRTGTQKRSARRTDETEIDGDGEDLLNEPTTTIKAKKSSRLPKQQLKAAINGDIVNNEDSLKLEGSQVDSSAQYWLMKAEPESRIEKGHDVRFSIDDLAARKEPESWDGVRNYVARNNMKTMRKGDLAFFYHSNCAVPGIAGVMRIVEEHSTDESAFDPDHPYYDPKSSRDKPRWEIVKVEFVKKFNDLITLKELRSLGQPGEALENMKLLKQSRLSVSSVSPAEWRYLLAKAGEDLDLGTT